MLDVLVAFDESGLYAHRIGAIEKFEAVREQLTPGPVPTRPTLFSIVSPLSFFLSFLRSLAFSCFLTSSFFLFRGDAALLFRLPRPNGSVLVYLAFFF